MNVVAALRLIILAILASNLQAATSIFPLKDIRPGQHGVGKTVFSGDRIEDFDVEILGVLENLGPKQSVILGRLSGGPLEKTGVLQGMSGSPVYIDGRLVGAVALAFTFAKEPIAGIRPIEDMIAVGAAPARESGTRLAGLSSRPGRMAAGDRDLIDIATPMSFNGFTPATIEFFSDQMRRLGLTPMQGVSSGSPLANKVGRPSDLKPGSMISVQLLSGDWSVSADGTVTEVDGNHVYAFGHRFLSIGGTELPFAKASVITTLANVSASFKISRAMEWMGTITEDRSSSVYGEIGKHAVTVPLDIGVSGALGKPESYHMQMVNDRILSPFLLQMAVFSAIDATERTLGMSTFRLRGQVEFTQGPPLKIENVYAGDFGAPQQASLGVSTPVSYIMSAGFDQMKVAGVKIDIEALERKRVLQIDQLAVSKRDVHPGDTVELAVTMTGENGVEVVRTLNYPIPVGAPAGVLSFTVSDATSANLLDYLQVVGVQPKSPQQVVSLLNALRPNNGAYVRVWRNDPAFQVSGAELPDPPSSVALLLAKSQSPVQNAVLGRGSTVAQLRVDTGDMVVTGSKSVQVEVKE